MLNKNKLIGLLAFCLCLSITGCSKRHISTDSDYYDLLSAEPIQEELSSSKTFNTDIGFTMSAQHSYKISARVLAVEKYGWDKGSLISPVDLALGWNKMSDKKLLDKSLIAFSQGTRFYFWRTPSFDVLSRKEIETNSANVHIVPENDKIKDYILEKVSKNDLIYMEGYLVDVKQELAGKSWYWKTSTTRNDTGAGACEIFYVTKVVHIQEKN